MRNETPVGLATVLGVLPAVLAGGLLITLLILNGGDVEAATSATLAIITALALVAAAGLRQWRAIAHEKATGPALPPPPAEAPGALPPPGEILEGDPLEPAA